MNVKLLMSEKEAKLFCLIVEDEEQTRFAFRLTLEKLGCEVAESADAIGAYQRLRDFRDNGHRPDFILLDLYLPSMSGIELIDRLQEEGNDIPLLVTSGFLTPVIRKKLEDRSIEHILPKPFRPGDLAKMIKEIENR